MPKSLKEAWSTIMFCFFCFRNCVAVCYTSAVDDIVVLLMDDDTAMMIDEKLWCWIMYDDIVMMDDDIVLILDENIVVR